MTVGRYVAESAVKKLTTTDTNTAREGNHCKGKKIKGKHEHQSRVFKISDFI